MARIEIVDHFEITGRGSVVTCHILDGVVRKGTYVETARSDPSRLTVSDVDFADNVRTGEVWIALRFRESPSLELLKELLPAGATIDVSE